MLLIPRASYGSFVLFLKKKNFFFKEVLDSQQNWGAGTENVHVPLSLLVHSLPHCNILHPTGQWSQPRNLPWTSWSPRASGVWGLTLGGVLSVGQMCKACIHHYNSLQGISTALNIFCVPCTHPSPSPRLAPTDLSMASAVLPCLESSRWTHTVCSPSDWPLSLSNMR